MINNPSRFTPRTSGFTLIELMIVVAVIAILTAMAYPAYNKHVIKTRRSEAQAELVKWGQAMERYYSTNGSYTSSGTTCNTVGKPGDTAFYTFTSACNPASTYTLTAGPKAGSLVEHDGNQTLDNTGAKTGTWQQ